MPGTNDLWPENIADSKLLTPLTILKEQAGLLGEKTKQRVQGEVVTQATGNLLVHLFYLVAPTLGYKYELFQVSHGINFYPLVIRHLNNTVQVTSESAFKENLKTILAEPQTVNAVHSILAQVVS